MTKAQIIVYRVRSELDRYQGLTVSPGDRDPVEPAWEAMLRDGAKGLLQPPFLEESWTAPRLVVVGRHRPPCDFSAFGVWLRAFSGRAVDILRPLLLASGELLPAVCEQREYSIYHVRTIADVLDVARSEIEWGAGAPQVIARRVNRFAFREGVEIPPLFRLPQTLYELYCSQQFVDLVERGGLSGFEFTPLWSSTHGPADTRDRSSDAAIMKSLRRRKRRRSGEK